MKNRVSIAFMAVSSAAALVWPLDSLHAQADRSPPAEGSATTTSGGGLAQDIIVTAQRRAQRLQDVPASIKVQSGEQLQALGISTTLDLTLVTPGLNIAMNGAFASPTIRGVSSQGTGPGQDNAVAVYIDGAYMASQQAGLFDFPDIERIEVLKGPQGALYGRNATGGALLIVTRDPGFTPEGNFYAGYGRYDDVELKGYVSAPLVADRLAASVAGYYRKHHGYDRDLVNGGHTAALDTKAIRAKLRFDPVEDLSFVLSGYYSDRYDESPFSQSIPNANSVGRRVNPNVLVPTRPNDVARNFPGFLSNKSKGMTLRGTYDGDVGTLTSITSYNKSDSLLNVDSDQTPAPAAAFIITTREKWVSQDINFATRKFGAISIVAGASFFDGNSAYDPLEVVGVISTFGKVKTRALASFLEATVDLTDRLSVIGAARYSYERKELSGSRNPANRFPPLAKKSWRDLTPRAVLKYRAGEFANLYASYSEGFKSGAFNASALSVIPVQPESIKAYEVGIKSEQLGIVRFDLSAFRYDYKDIQVATTLSGVAVVINAAAARMKGIDAEVVLTPATGLRLRTGLSLLDAKFTDFPAGTINIPRPAFNPSSPGTTCPVNTFPCGNIAFTTNLSGNRPQRAPKVTGNIGIDYVTDLGRGEVTFNANAYFSDGFFWELGNRIKQGAYEVVNARATWAPNKDSGPRFGVYGKNLTNQIYGQGASVSTNADGISFASPRSYGVSIEYSF